MPHDHNTTDATGLDQEDRDFRERIAHLLYANGDVRAGWSYTHCHEPGLGFVGHCFSCGPVYWSPQSCDLRICPLCAGRRTQSLISHYAPAVSKLVQHLPHFYQVRHLVLTTSISLLDYISFDPETDRIDLDLLAELRQKVQDLRVRARVCLQEFFGQNKAVGGMIGVEFGSAGYRLHFHVALLSPFVMLEKLSKRWESVNGGVGRVIYVVKHDGIDGSVESVMNYVVKELAYGGTHKTGKREATEHTQKADALVQGLGSPVIAAAMHFLYKGVRRLQPWGAFYDLPREESDPCVCPHCEGKVWWESEVDFYRRDGLCESLNLRIGNNFGPDPPHATGATWEQLSFLPDAPQYR